LIENPAVIATQPLESVVPSPQDGMILLAKDN
jgi:hypothetical protein